MKDKEPEPKRTEDRRPWNEENHPRRSDGKFGKGGNKGSTKSNEHGSVELSPKGVNRLWVRGFANKQKLMNHWKNGRTHRDEYPDFTIGQYVARAVQLAEMPVGGDILGHIDKDGIIIRYDRKTNDFVKASITKGFRTMFKPIDGESYYINMCKEDIERGGKG
ncbi:hypothetical protein [Mitsuokella sp. AF21-1AC]|uniref:hypothetical protein n=1 Tax=Mitsuokella sp. AF21-1AC TaxID=2292235 RepID=UPI000E480CE5|nr:hypothetical protein [Mitsuokella sp. AF21-1AC]RGS69959.1 hypothetical protein DWX75_11460 [Mitsuokella sp. AF21-1AC]